jgi:hypothetical protein
MTSTNVTQDIVEFKTKIMTQEQKRIISISLLPVFADMLEDVPMKQLAKSERNKLIAAIRAFDAFFMNGADAEEAEEQVNIQRWFREILEKELVN